MKAIIEEQIDEVLFNYLATEPARVLGFLDGLVAAGYMDGVRRDELIKSNPMLHRYLYGEFRGVAK